MFKKAITRRKLLKDVTKAAIGGTLFLNTPWKVFGGEAPDKTKVVLIRDEKLLDEENNCRADVIQHMLENALMELTGETNSGLCWKKLIQPSDVVGIKTNEWGRLRTPPELEQAIVKGVKSVGVSEENISVKDRGVLRDPVFGRATALINVRPLRTHAWSGVGSLIKNPIMFSPNPSSYHNDSCADLATLWENPLIKGKVKLNILVMVTPLFHGVGPHHFNKEYIWPYKGILVGTDPVAVDSVGLKILQARRNEYFGEDRPLNPPAKHILLADTRHGLGTADPKKINLVKLGWDEGILI